MPDSVASDGHPENADSKAPGPKSGIPKAAVMGWPIDHSRSPIIHRHWLRELGLAGEYERLAIAPDDIPDLKAILVDRDLVGGNITIPHKEAAFRLADHVDPVARALGAANTLWFEAGQLCATNTDGYGFLANLDDRVPGWDAAPGKAVVLGAGGAARAVIWALLQRNFDPVIVVNRTLEKAEILADQFGSRLVATALTDFAAAQQGAGFLVNTTSLGMHGASDFDLPLTGLAEDAVVTDIVYTPLETDLLRQAACRRLRTADGLGMLLHQAVPGFEKWFGNTPEVTTRLRQILVDDLDPNTREPDKGEPDKGESDKAESGP